MAYQPNPWQKPIVCRPEEMGVAMHALHEVNVLCSVLRHHSCSLPFRAVHLDDLRWRHCPCDHIAMSILRHNTSRRRTTTPSILPTADDGSDVPRRRLHWLCTAPKPAMTKEEVRESDGGVLIDCWNPLAIDLPVTMLLCST